MSSAHIGNGRTALCEKIMLFNMLNISSIVLFKFSFSLIFCLSVVIAMLHILCDL